jgi:hypothetical protein
MKKKTLVLIAFLAFLLAAWPNTARAQGGFENVTGEALTKAVPDHFDLEKNRIPVQKIYAALLKNGKGAQVVLAMLDTGNSSPRIRRKYSGILISGTKISLCRIPLDTGSYGFGLSPKAPGEDYGKFRIYNQAGDELGECDVKIDASIKESKPLAVSTAKGGPTKITMFKYAMEIQ